MNEDEDPKYMLITADSIRKICSAFATEEELKLFISEFYILVNFCASSLEIERFTTQDREKFSINFLFKMALFMKNNAECIRDMVKSLDYIQVSKNEFDEAMRL